MPERHVCTQIYTLQLNYVPDIERTLTRVDQVEHNGTLNNWDSTVHGFNDVR